MPRTRFSLKTALIGLALLPPFLAIYWDVVRGLYQREPLVLGCAVISVTCSQLVVVFGGKPRGQP